MRPQEVTWAFWLIVVNAVGGILFTLLVPDIDDRGTFIAVGAVFSALMLITGWLLWGGNRWGSIGALVVQALNILLAIPAFFDPDPKSLAAGSAVSIVLSAASIWFAVRPASRAYWNKR